MTNTNGETMKSTSESFNTVLHSVAPLQKQLSQFVS